MPWKECSKMNEKMKFIARYLEGERVSDLCREFEISRKTGYKFIERYKTQGIQGLIEKPRVALSHPHKTTDAVIAVILEIKTKYPTWGAAKIKEYISKRYSGTTAPAKSTIHRILEQNNLVTKKKRRGPRSVGTMLDQSSAPNDIWATDFKGQFKLGNNKYCYPLTLTDHFSRFLIACEGFDSISEKECFYTFERAFRDYGLPNKMRSDNGVPFSSKNYFGLSSLSVWWLRLGIQLERIKPGNPQENGRHERMHRTLKKCTTNPPAKNALQQQEQFDEFIRIYNEERPHEGLNMRTPSDLYKKSIKLYPEVLEDLSYEECDNEYRVSKCGSIGLPGRRRIFVGTPFKDQILGVKQIDEEIFEIYFMSYKMGFIDDESDKLNPINSAFWETR